MGGAAKQTKDESRAAYIAVIRPLVRRLQASPVVSDAEKASLGITVAQTPTPIGPPTTAPIVSIECGMRLQQTLRFADSATPTRKAKPAGALGVEIWNKVGLTPPAGEADLRFVAVDTNAPYVDEALKIAERLPDSIVHSLAPARRGPYYHRLYALYFEAKQFDKAEQYGLLSVESHAALFPYVNEANENAARRMIRLYSEWRGHSAQLREWCVQELRFRMMLADVKRAETVPAEIEKVVALLRETQTPTTGPEFLEELWRRRDEMAPPRHARRAAFFANYALTSAALSHHEHFAEAISLAEASLASAQNPVMAEGLISNARSRRE